MNEGDLTRKNFAQSLAEMVDELYVNEETSEAYEKNPYNETNIRMCLNKYLAFFATKGDIESYDIKQVISNPDMLSVSLNFKHKGKEFSFDMHTKF